MKQMTKNSLGDAFAGESQAHMKYMAFAEIAEKEGFPNVARLFKATSYAEQVHAINHARNLGYLGKTVDNLQTGINGENFEVDEMYPAYDAIAKLQGEKGAEKSIHFAVEAEKIHADYYQQAKAQVEKGKDIGAEDIYICPVCGYTKIGEPPDNCPVCNVAKDKFKKF
ncbi:rubrerythrin family protein [candidate division KSB1 bacterium]|nr:rubrerythrin family protein [candidate division KSB1 bacterium]